jgi:hypothetical protein
MKSLQAPLGHELNVVAFVPSMVAEPGTKLLTSLPHLAGTRRPGPTA